MSRADMRTGLRSGGSADTSTVGPSLGVSPLLGVSPSIGVSRTHVAPSISSTQSSDIIDGKLRASEAESLIVDTDPDSGAPSVPRFLITIAKIFNPF